MTALFLWEVNAKKNLENAVQYFSFSYNATLCPSGAP